MATDYADIAEQLAGPGWCVTPNFIDADLLSQLAEETQKNWDNGQFRPAGIGRGDALQIRPEIRNDHVQWVDPRHCSPAKQAYLDTIEQLRQALNRTVFLGLFDFECHLAVYPIGSFYRRHLDRFQNNSRRTVSTVLYLNHHWGNQDGGELRLYPGTDTDVLTSFIDIQPIGGTLVVFLSDRFPHEVLPAKRARISLTGWFRTRETT